MKYTLSDFLPLIIIFLVIIFLTAIKQSVFDTWQLYHVMSDFMGFFFVIFGLFKVANIRNFAHAYAMYDLVAKRSMAYAYVYPFIELSLGTLYLTHTLPFFTNIATLIVMLISSAGVAIELIKQRPITCACLGLVFKIPMTWVTLFEDLLMALMALLMLIF